MTAIRVYESEGNDAEAKDLVGIFLCQYFANNDAKEKTFLNNFEIKNRQFFGKQCQMK